MKKNFLFGLLAVLLAGFWFGGASLAENCNVDSVDSLVASFSNNDCTTIKLTNSVVISSVLTVSREVTLDLNGKTISKASGTIISVGAGGNLTIDDNSDNKEGKVKIAENTSDGTAVSVSGGGIVVIDNGEYEGGTAVYVSDEGSQATINGGNFIGTKAGNRAAIHAVVNGLITINGGTFTAQPSDTGKPQKVIYAGANTNACNSPNLPEDQQYKYVQGKIIVNDGTFVGRFSRSNLGEYEIKGGTFTPYQDKTAGVGCDYSNCDDGTNDPKSCTDVPGILSMLSIGYSATKNNNGEYVVSPKQISVKAATIPTDTTKESRNLGKFTVSFDATNKKVTITDNGLVAFDNPVGTNGKWVGLIVDLGVFVNGGISSDSTAYGIEDCDRNDVDIYGGNTASNTDFIIWITREAKNGKKIRFVNQADDSDYVEIQFEFKDKQSTSSGGGGGGSSKKSETTKTDDAKANTGDIATVDDKNAEDKNDETKADDDAKVSVDANKNGNADTAISFSQEFKDAYKFARENGITTKDSIEEADMYGPLTRIAMAKMLSQYAINVLGKTPDTTKVVPAFPDVSAQLDADYDNGVTLAYQLGIMGIGIEEFRPFAEVTRAEFGTALSRMLFGLADGEGAEWYKTHLDKLMNEQIITNDNPNLKELRGYVMIMLMRSAQ